MNAEQEEYIRIIGRSTDNEILIKRQGGRKYNFKTMLIRNAR